MFSSKSGSWETPKSFFAKLYYKHKFTTDVGASKKNALCKDYLGLDNGRDALTSSWGAVNFCNPPYGRGIRDWIDRAINEAEQQKIVVMLLPSRTGSQWFYRLIQKASNLDFVIGRLQFTVDGKPILNKQGHPTSAPFDSIVVTLDYRTLHEGLQVGWISAK
jgi:site-specific DNA-methyltransferase (adenine-specific)